MWRSNQRQKSAQRRLRVEALEERTTPSVTSYHVSVDDYVTLKINNALVASYDAFPWGVTSGSVDLPSGWYPFEMVYQNRFGSTGLQFYSRTEPTDPWQVVPLDDLRSLDASGAVVQGLRADYFTLSGASLGTVFGEGPIYHGWNNLYEGSTGRWGGGLVDTNWGLFRERLTGEIFIHAPSDIDVQSAKFDGDTVQFTYKTEGSPGQFEMGLYRSTDGITINPADRVGDLQIITPSPNGGTGSGTFTIGTLTPDPDLPYLVVVADPSNTVEESKEDNNSASVRVIQITSLGLNDKDASYLRFLSVSSSNPYGPVPVHGTLRVEGAPNDSLSSLELVIQQNGITVAIVPLASQATGLLRPFGSSGVIELTQPQFLFQITNAVASAINTSQDGYLFLRVRATSSLGSTAEADWGLVQILTRYAGTNRYGPRDVVQGGDDWVLPSVNRLLTTFTGVLFGDMSNMNGGPFSPHASHQDGFDVDFKFAGYQAGQSMTDNKGAKLLAEVINSLPLDTVNRIQVMFATVDQKFIKQVEKRLSPDRKFFADRIHYETGHADHFHLRFLP